MTGKQPAVTIRAIGDYRPDPENANKGTDRGRSAVRKSLEEVGAARSVVVSADDVLLAGNQTVREARAAGIREVVEVETDGAQLVVVKRRDLRAGSELARKLGLYDNRTSELGLDWDQDALRAILDSAKVPDEIMTADEIALLTGRPSFAPVGADEQGRLDQKKPVTCPECGHEFVPEA